MSALAISIRLPVAASRRTSSLVGLVQLVSLDHLPVGGRHGDRHVAFLDLLPGPEDRLDDLLGAQALREGRQLRSDDAALGPDLVTGDAGELRVDEDPGPAPGVAVALGPRRSMPPPAGDRRSTPRPAGRGAVGRPEGPRLRPRPGGLAVELRDEPVEAVEVVAQPLLGVVLGVAEDADRARGSRCRGSSAAGPGRARPGRAAGSSCPVLSPPGHHPVEVQRPQVRLHLREQVGEAVEVVVAVVQVVDDADVGDALRFRRSMMATWFSGSPNQPPWL